MTKQEVRLIALAVIDDVLEVAAAISEDSWLSPREALEKAARIVREQIEMGIR